MVVLLKRHIEWFLWMKWGKSGSIKIHYSTIVDILNYIKYILRRIKILFRKCYLHVPHGGLIMTRMFYLNNGNLDLTFCFNFSYVCRVCRFTKGIVRFYWKGISCPNLEILYFELGCAYWHNIDVLIIFSSFFLISTTQK